MARTFTATFASWWRRRHEFIDRELPVTVFVQRQQRGGGVGDFGRIDHPIVVRIERADERRRRTVARAAWATRSALTHAPRRTLVLCRPRAGVLRGDHPR